MSDSWLPKVAVGCALSLVLCGVLVVGVPIAGCFGLGMAIEAGAIPPAEVVRAEAMPAEIRREFKVEILQEGEELILVQANAISDWLGEGFALTDRRVIEFWRGSDGVVGHEAIGLHEVASIEVESSSWPDPTMVRVRSHGGSLLVLELDDMNSGDERFIARLRTLTGHGEPGGGQRPEPSTQPRSPAPPDSRGPRAPRGGQDP